MRGFVYRFLDDNHTILYVGKTKNIRTRMRQHFHSGHLSKEQYENVKKIEYIEYPSYNDAGIMERVLIDYFKPPYNTEFTKEGRVTISIQIPPERDWTLYCEESNVQRIPEKKFRKKPISPEESNMLYFKTWYDGCSCIYTDGSGYRFFKRLKLSDYMLDYKMICETVMPHYNEQFVYGYRWLNYYVSDEIKEWAKEDNIPIITSFGEVFHNGAIVQYPFYFKDDTEEGNEVYLVSMIMKTLWDKEEYGACTLGLGKSRHVYMNSEFGYYTPHKPEPYYHNQFLAEVAT